MSRGGGGGWAATGSGDCERVGESAKGRLREGVRELVRGRLQVAARGERVGVGRRRVKVARPVSVMHCSIGTRDALRRASGVTGRGGRREGSMRRLRLEARMGLEA